MNSSPDKLISGVSELIITGGVISGSSIRIPSNANIKIDNNKHSYRRVLGSSKENNSTENYWEYHQRRLMEGTRHVLVVRVTDKTGKSTTASAEKLSRKIFGEGINDHTLVTQYKACSYGKLIFKPTMKLNGNDPPLSFSGVYDVTIPIRVENMDNLWVQNNVTAQLKKEWKDTSLPRGYKDYHTDDSSPFDHIIYCIPPGTEGTWVAFGYENGWLTIMNDAYCERLSSQMHELGHNLRVTHAGMFP